MHIGLIIYGILGTVTGGYIYDRILVKHLRDQGHRVEVVSLPVRAYLQCLADNLSTELFQRLLQESFDVLLQDELCHPSLFLMNKRLNRRTRYPIVSIVHQVLCDEPRSPWKNFLYGLIEKRYLSSVCGFVFNSMTTKRTVNAMSGNGRPSVIAYPAGDRLGACLDASDLKTRVHKSGPLELFFLGNMIPRKGLHPLLEKLSDVCREKWRLNIAGSSEMDRKYAQRVRKLIGTSNLSNNVRLWGVLEGERLAAMMHRSHLLFMPYSYEGFGIVYMEGMAFGLPAVGSQLGAAREIIHHGFDGFLVNPNDSSAIRDIIEKLYQDKDLLLKMSESALKTFQSHPKWETSMGLIDCFLEAIVRSSTSRGH